MNNRKILKLFLLTIAIFFTAITSCTSGKYQELSKLSVPEISAKLIFELKNGNYTFVEKYFDFLLKTKETSENGTKRIDDIYINISQSNKGFELSMIDNWCNNSAHYSAYLLKGLYYINDAWRDRGDSYAINVSKPQFELFHEKLQLAKNSLEEAFKKNENDSYISVAMMMVCRGLGLDNDTFELWYNRAISADPSSYYIYLQKFQHLLPKWGGSWEATFDFVSSMREKTPTGSFAYMLYLDVMLEAIYYKEARQYIGNPSYEEQLVTITAIEKRLFSDFPGSKLNIIKRERLKGGIYFMLDKPIQAESCFRKILEEDPNYHWAWYMLGQMYYKSLNKPKEAIVFFDKAIELNPKEKMYYDERGTAASRANLADLCISDLTYSITSTSSFYNRTSWHTYYTRAGCYMSKNRYDTAIEDYSVSYKMKPERNTTLIDRAKAYYLNKNIKYAIIDLKDAIRNDPNNKYATNLLEQYEAEIRDIQ